MKRKLSFLLMLVILLTTVLPGVDAYAASTAKLNKRETAIIKAYVKSIETEDLKYINKLKYPGLTYHMTNFGDVDIHFAFNKYFKKYDKKAKMNCLYVTTKLIVSNKKNIAIYDLTMGIYTKSKNKVTYAYQENSSKFTGSEPVLVKMDELAKSQKNAVYDYLKTLYDETTAKELMGIVEPGTIKAPIAMNTAFTWKEETDYLLDEVISADFTLKVVGSEDITSQAETYRFKLEDDQELKLLTVEFDVKSATIIKADGVGEMLLGKIRPYVWGSESKEGSRSVDYNDSTFEGSLSKVIDQQLNSENIKSGETKSYSITGKVAVATKKNETNYLVISNFGENSKIYFAIQ